MVNGSPLHYTDCDCYLGKEEERDLESLGWSIGAKDHVNTVKIGLQNETERQ